MSKRYTTEEFVEKAILKHGTKYNYSLVTYKDSVTPVTIVCPEHGEFKQRPAMHLAGQGCPDCGRELVKKALSDTRESFIEKAIIAHNNKYNYSLVDYQGSEKPVRIICPLHGEFKQTPHVHLSGQGCPICGRKKSDENRRKGWEYFLKQAREVHGDKYDYSKVHLKTRREKVCIVCPTHGEFWQEPYNHTVQKQGCPWCARESNAAKITKDTEWFLDKAKSIHGNRYDYSETKYISAKDKLCVICHELDDGGQEHGRFWLTPHQHLTHSGGCPKCGHPKHTREWWIKEARKVHGDRYDYSKVVYNNNKDYVTIICPEHGEFQQMPMYHLKGGICPKCNGRNLTTAEIIEQFKAVHGDRYDYSKVNYVNKTTEVRIICRKHGEFSQKPAGHLRGNGCPICNQSHLENDVEMLLKRHKIQFYKQKTFPWLKDTGALKLDFFIPEYGVAIECQGEQHFIASDFMGGEEKLLSLQRRDRLKESLCLEHGINILYYSDLGYDYPYPVIEDISLLLEAIYLNGDFDSSALDDPKLPLEF